MLPNQYSSKLKKKKKLTKLLFLPGVEPAMDLECVIPTTLQEQYTLK